VAEDELGWALATPVVVVVDVDWAVLGTVTADCVVTGGVEVSDVPAAFALAVVEAADGGTGSTTDWVLVTVVTVVAVVADSANEVDWVPWVKVSGAGGGPSMKWMNTKGPAVMSSTIAPAPAASHLSFVGTLTPSQARSSRRDIPCRHCR
jgi:hypothetical protein